MAIDTLYTIGYEGASVAELVGALQAACVSRLIDIRYSPYSRRKAFCREELAPALAAYSIAYTHLRALGNPPAGREAARLGHRAVYREIFGAHLDGGNAQAELRQVLEAAAREPVCLMCLERAPRQCHRTMVAERLAQMASLEVKHLQISHKTAHPGQSTFDF
jgi:uncharacterized protein (DUF488 family)